MADNYDQATITPSIPKAALTPKRREILEAAGFTLFQESDGYYAYTEDGTRDEDFETDTPINWQGVFVEICEEFGIEEFIMEGAYTCSKPRSGEFGGYVIRFTKDNVQYGSNNTLIELMREGKL